MIGTFYARVARPVLFLMDAEKVHGLTFKIAKFFFRSRKIRRLIQIWSTRGMRPMPRRIGNLDLVNPLGLAAGFDKNAELLPGIDALGFGFVEIGTITPRAQEGNPKPRIERMPDRRAILNRMGFNNLGGETVSSRLRNAKARITVPIGVNIGKNRDTPNSEAFRDYEKLFQLFAGTADYFVVNVSSPNTPGLRDLQSEEFALKLGEVMRKLDLHHPVFLKLSPELESENLRALCRLCGDGRPFCGLVLTNTIPTDLGGISGAPLKGPSLSMLKNARMHLPKEAHVISVGGIETGQDAWERLEAGATAVQIYSSLIYQGPTTPRRILMELRKILRNRGISDLSRL